MTAAPPSELEKFRAHSVLLNRILWRMQEVLGDVGPNDTEKYGEPDEIVRRFFERAAAPPSEPRVCPECDRQWNETAIVAAPPEGEVERVCKWLRTRTRDGSDTEFHQAAALLAATARDGPVLMDELFDNDGKPVPCTMRKALEYAHMAATAEGDEADRLRAELAATAKRAEDERAEWIARRNVLAEKAARAESALAQARYALRELVALEDLSDRMDRIPAHPPNELRAALAEYNRRAPLAWKAARAAIDKGDTT